MDHGTMQHAAVGHAASETGRQWMELIHDPERIAKAGPAEVMPLFQGMMRGGCKRCPSTMTRICKNLEQPFSVIGHDLASQWLGMRWEFKAEDFLAGGASDGRVPHSAVRAVIAATEELARERGHDAVSVADYVESIGTLSGDYAYRASDEQLDAEFVAAVEAIESASAVIARGNREHHERADAYRKDPTGAERNTAEIVASLPFDGLVHDELMARDLTWCQHVPHLFPRLLMRRPAEAERLLELFDLIEAVAAEREHPGVTPRDVQTALMRAAATGIETRTDEG